ncbi:hypothetical protein [Nostoc sp. C052]|nr:hypothetical protein [Nostoc sp. C052]
MTVWLNYRSNHNKSPELYQQFAMNVLALSRKLNAPSNTQTRQPQTQIQA